LQVLSITSMRNEGPFCLEWIAHHLAAGVGHFLIYSNDCDDGTDIMLDELAAAGIVTHVPQHPDGRHTVQWQALRHAAKHALYKQSDWVLVSDCDEFINLRTSGATLQDLIAALPVDTDALAMPWRLFGNSGLITASDDLTIARFTRAAPEDIGLPLAHFFKSLFRPKAFRQIGVHRPKRKKDTAPVWVDGGGNRFSANFATMDHRINLFGLPNSRDLIQLNHYSVRSAQEFMVKRTRGLPNHTGREIGLGYWTERNFNTVQDDSILPMLAATRSELDRLLGLGRLVELQQQSRDIHRAKFEKQMENRGEVQLLWQLGLSAGSRPPSAEFSQAQLQRMARAGNANG